MKATELFTARDVFLTAALARSGLLAPDLIVSALAIHVQERRPVAAILRERYLNAEVVEALRVLARALASQPHDIRVGRARATMKTNAVRALEALGIKLELHDYEVDEDDLTAETVARKVGLPPEQVWKTLVARGDRHGVCLAVVPGNAELDLKGLARVTGDRKVETVALKEVQSLTGYIRGGVTALAGKKDYPVFVDETVELYDVISISAGVRGTQVFLAPADYLRATKATLGAIAKDKS